MIRRLTSSSIALYALVALSACATFPPTEESVVPASTLIDNIKAELAKVSISPVKAPGGVCSNSQKEVVVVAIPASATVSLKAVTTLATSGTGGGTFPVLGIPVGPSFTYTNTRAVTQVVTFDLAIVHDPKTEADLTAEIKTLRAQIDANTSSAKDLDGKLSHEQIEFLKEHIKTDSTAVAADEAALLELHMASGYTGVTVLDADLNATTDRKAVTPRPVAFNPTTESIKKDMTLAEAVSAAGQELLSVNHNLKPCLKPQTVKVEIDFDLQKKKDGSLSITVVAWKFGTERVATSEQYHSVVVTFDLTQGSTNVVQ